MINENYTTNYEVACAILDKLENGGGSTGGGVIYPKSITFQSLTDLTEIDLSSIGSDNLTTLSNFFNNCSNLTKVTGLNHFQNVEKITNFEYAYSNTPSLIYDGGLHSLPFTNKISSANSVFYKCGLPSIDISRWTIKYTNVSQFFREAKAVNINISNQDFSTLTSVSSSAFEYCYNLEEVKCENTIFPAVNFNYFPSSTKLSKQSILDMFNQLLTASATVKIPRHILNSLTEDELLIATNKGWTVNA